MQLINHHFFRVFVAILVAVFVANTVYAGGRMVSAKGGLLDMHHTDYMSTVITDVTAHHCHDQLLSHDQLSQDRQDAQHQSKHHSSSHCHHCMACYSIMLNSQLDMASIRSQPILTIAATRGYLAPVTPQPSKPPIL